MAKKIKDYFQHDYRSRNDQKLIEIRIKYRMAGIGVFWCLTEMVHEHDNKLDYNLDAIAFELQDDKEMIQFVIDKCFDVKDNIISHKRIDANLSFREKFRVSGEKGAKARWGKDSDPIGTPLGGSLGSDSIDIVIDINKDKDIVIGKDKDIAIDIDRIRQIEEEKKNKERIKRLFEKGKRLEQQQNNVKN